MDRDAGQHDRSDEAERGDTGMIGSEAEEPGPGRDTSLTEPDPAAASTEQPRGTVAMSEGDPMRTRLGSHVEGAGVIGYDVVAAEEGATQQTPAEDRPAYEPERTPGETSAAPAPAAAPGYGDPALSGDPGRAGEPGLAGERVDDAGPTDRSAFAGEPVTTGSSDLPPEDTGAADRTTLSGDPAGYGAGAATAGYESASGGAGSVGTGGFASAGTTGGAESAGYEGEPGGTGMAGYQEPGRDVPASYTGEEADVTGRPEYADRTEGGEQALYQEEPQRLDRSGGGGSLFTDEEPERLDRPGPQEPGVEQGVYDQEADQARRERPTDGT
jgi:hypothetical protein